MDIATVPWLRQRLSALADDGRPLIADLDQVTFIDAAGLGTLISSAHRAAAHGASLHVVGARPRIRRLFQLTGLDRQLRLARTLPEPVQDLRPARTSPPTGPAVPAGHPLEVLAPLVRICLLEQPR